MSVVCSDFSNGGKLVLITLRPRNTVANILLLLDYIFNMIKINQSEKYVTLTPHHEHAPDVPIFILYLDTVAIL